MHPMIRYKPLPNETRFPLGRVSYGSGELIIYYWFSLYHPADKEKGKWAFWKSRPPF